MLMPQGFGYEGHGGSEESKTASRNFEAVSEECPFI